MGPAAPAPEIDSITPSTGLWGTSVTIDGAHFGASATTGTVSFGGGVGTSGFVVDQWGDSEIRGRVGFPATGTLSIQTSAGVGSATFTTMEPWVPSGALDVAELSAEIVLSTGDVAAIYQQYELSNQPTLAVFSGTSVGVTALGDYAVAGSGATTLALLEADDHTPEIIATQPDDSVAEVTLGSGSATKTETGLTGAVVAAARDATGRYAWVNTAAGLVRARPGATWTVDRGPFAVTDAPLVGAVAADGTLWVVVSQAASAGMADVAIAQLGSADTALGSAEIATAAPVAGTITQAQIQIAPDGVHALVQATATSGQLTPRERTAAATWIDVGLLPGLAQLGFVGGSTLGAIVNDATMKSTSLVPDVTMPAGAQVIPVWPMQTQGFAVDGSGAPYPLITNGDVAYALTPPPAS
jgi:hypothetical protein